MSSVRLPRRIGSLDDARERARRDDEPDGQDQRGADGRQCPNERPVERQPPERPPRQHRDEADRRDRRGQPDAESNDERQARGRSGGARSRRGGRRAPTGRAGGPLRRRRRGSPSTSARRRGRVCDASSSWPCTWSWSWCACPRERRRCLRTDAPTATTSTPETSVSHGYSCSGTMNAESPSVTNPSAKTPAVWAMVTVPPRRKASRGRPFVPTR